MQKYELTVLIHPDLEPKLDKAIETIVKLVEKTGGKVIKQDIWGKKNLAYAIKKQLFANYVHFGLELPTDAPLKISNVLNISKEVIRYLLIKTDSKKDAEIEAQNKRAAEAKEEK